MDFQFETAPVKEAPANQSKKKYDWSKFPAPTTVDGEEICSKAYMEGCKYSPVSKSIGQYRDRLKRDKVKDEDLPVFSIETIKEGEGAKAQVVGVTVWRIK